MIRKIYVGFLFSAFVLAWPLALITSCEADKRRTAERQQLAFEFFKAQNPSSTVTFEQWKAHVEMTTPRIEETTIVMPSFSTSGYTQ